MLAALLWHQHADFATQPWGLSVWCWNQGVGLLVVVGGNGQVLLVERFSICGTIGAQDDSHFPFPDTAFEGPVCGVFGSIVRTAHDERPTSGGSFCETHQVSPLVLTTLQRIVDVGDLAFWGLGRVGRALHEEESLVGDVLGDQGAERIVRVGRFRGAVPLFVGENPVVIAGELFECQTDLADVTHGLHTVCSPEDTIHCGRRERRQDCDDRDNHQKFDQGEALTVTDEFFHFS